MYEEKLAGKEKDAVPAWRERCIPKVRQRGQDSVRRGDGKYIERRKNGGEVGIREREREGEESEGARWATSCRATIASPIDP